MQPTIYTLNIKARTLNTEHKKKIPEILHNEDTRKNIYAGSC